MHAGVDDVFAFVFAATADARVCGEYTASQSGERRERFDGFASKVDVAPKVAFLPQKSFHILIAFADYDLPVAISGFVFVLAAFFTLVGLLVGLEEYVGLVFV